MLARIALVCLVVAAAPALAGPAVEIHASCAADVAADAAHIETLKSELARALIDAPRAHVIDISLVQLDTRPEGTELVVRAEVRALVSDPKRGAQWVTSSRATARGAAKDRSLIQRDAISAAAREVAKTIRRR